MSSSETRKDDIVLFSGITYVTENRAGNEEQDAVLTRYLLVRLRRTHRLQEESYVQNSAVDDSM